jgi:hypothetical protein
MQADDFSELEQRHVPGRATFYGGREHRTPPHDTESLLTLGCRRLRQILDVTWFIVRLSPMCRVFPVGRHVEFGYCYMLQPIPFLALRTVH